MRLRGGAFPESCQFTIDEILDVEWLPAQSDGTGKQ
jgi:hypothetical protein